MASSPPRPGGTILITGGNGSLGSAIAIQIAKSQPGKYHLILTARKLDDARTIETSAALGALNASYEFLTLDLSSLENVKAFTAKVKERVQKGELPNFDGGGIVLSAAMLTFVKDSRTKDGWNEMYGINVLAQHLITRELLPVLEGALVVNIASSTHNMGTVDYFSSEGKGVPSANGTEVVQETLGLGEAMKRYGSSKLLFIMSSYALQRRLNAKAHNTTQIVCVDPGGMSGDSHMGARESWIIRFTMLILGILAPLVRLLRKDAYNPPEVPAKAIADLFGRNEKSVGGRYFVLDDEVKSSATSLDEKLQDEALEKVCTDLDLGLII